MAAMSRWVVTVVVVVVCVVSQSWAKPSDFYDLDEEEMQELMENLGRDSDNHNIFNGGDLSAFFGYPAESEGGRNWHDWEMESMGGEGGMAAGVPHDSDVYDGKLEVVPDWPTPDPKLGQVGGVAVDGDNNPHVFHRAGRTWEEDTFFPNHTYKHRSDGPVKDATLLKLDGSTGQILSKWGENRFYMPHGLTIDDNGNFWVTDVAMHQVFKFARGQQEPSLVLGKEFQPAQGNDDETRFCKPTDVAVGSNGDIYVADGYCNSRIMKFDKTGQFLAQIHDGDLWVPHSVVIMEDMDLLCVADRENMRIACYNAGLKNPSEFGQLDREYTEYDNRHGFLGRVFAISYSPKDGMLYAVTGPTGDRMPQGFTIDMKEDGRYKTDVIAVWSPDDKGFEQPHDLAVSPDGESVYVGEIGPDKLWKFVKQ